MGSAVLYNLFTELGSDFFWMNVQAGNSLKQELNRVRNENNKLSEMLSVISTNYNALRRQLMEYMNKNNPEKELNSSKKRKSESSNNNNGNDIGGSSIDDDSCNKKLKEEPTKVKISKSYVRTEASDTSLVSIHIYIYI